MQLDVIRTDVHRGIERRLEPVNRALADLGIRPNHITYAGTGLCVGSAGLVVAEQPVLGGIVWLLGSALDLLDGSLARQQDSTSRAGAFLDSTLDRISEGAIFAAIAYHFADNGEALEAALTVLALLGSLLISYTRARAESLGADCKVGIVTRAERVVLIGLGLCFGFVAFAIYLLVALTAISVGQRIRHSVRILS